MKFVDIVNTDGFKIKNLDIKDVLDIEKSLPSNRSASIDLNIASKGLVLTLEGQNICQEKIALLDRYLGLLDGKKNQAWAYAALEMAKEKGFKTAKDKEWYALSLEILANNKNGDYNVSVVDETESSPQFVDEEDIW